MKCSLGIYNFLKRSLSFPFYCFPLFLCIERKAFLSLLVILCNSTFRWIYLSFSSLSFISLLCSGICKTSSDNFAFWHLFFLGMVLITASCTVLWTSVHSSSGTLSIRSNPLNLSFPLYNHKGFDLGHTRKVLWVSLCSVQFSHSVVSDSLRPHGLQHARPPCPSPTPRVYSNSCPLSR